MNVLTAPDLHKPAFTVADQEKPTALQVVWDFALLVAVGVATLVVLPYLYSALLFGASSQISNPPIVARHLWLLGACSFAVGGCALRLRGRRRTRAGTLTTLTVLIHGGFLAWVLVTRSYYSRPLIFLGPLISAALTMLIFKAEDLVRSQRIAVITLRPDQEALSWLGQPFRVLTDPEETLRDVDVVIVDQLNELSAAQNELVSRAMLLGKDVRHLAEYVEDARGRCSMDHSTFFGLRDPGVQAYAKVKRVMDLAIVALMLPVAIPVTLAAAVLVKITMGGPVIFTQQRIGHRGRVFTILKLRTMSAGGVGPDEGGATVVGDLRITRLGGYLRRYRIDELPQLWNVLAGQMSLVGPRPEQPALAMSYAASMPLFACRLLVRPGISGWAQVCAGYAADLSETRVKLSYDLYYVKNVSLALDLKIMLKTLVTIALSKGAR